MAVRDKKFLDELETLHARGARRFKFVDRTFNLNIKTSLAILEFFIHKIEAAPDDPCFVHFELVPDHLPDALKTMIARFPAGALQFEIGIQTFNTEVQQRISRKQDNRKAADNLTWLRSQSQAHLHVDLIAGLPGEDLTSFARGFDRLHALRPHEIQLGILKRLRGTPIIRHTEAFGMRYNDAPPYNVLATACISEAEMLRIERFARYWDLVANSGRFACSLPALLKSVLESGSGSAFRAFMEFSDWLYEKQRRTHRIGFEELCESVHEFLCTWRGTEVASVNVWLLEDYRRSGAHGRPTFLAKGLSVKNAIDKKAQRAMLARQIAHHAV